MSFIENYRKSLLIAIVLIAGFAIFYELTPFVGGLLGALTIYILVRKQMNNLVEKRKMKKGFAAFLILIEVILVFLIPLTFIVLLLIDKVASIDINPQQLLLPVENMANIIRQKTGYDLLKTENLTGLVSQVPKIGQYLMNGVSSFSINVVTLLFVLYFMLIDSKRMEQYIYEILPFNDENKKEVLKETKLIVTSNAIGIPLLGVIQGIVALGGYYLFNTPAPLFFGLMTCIATVIPMVGTAIVWAPLAIYLAITGQWGYAIGLSAYGILVITQIDNLVRFMLQKKMADIHPLITIFGVIIGLSLFGFMGVIFGPLLISMFLLCFSIFKKEYLDNNSA